MSRQPGELFSRLVASASVGKLRNDSSALGCSMSIRSAASHIYTLLSITEPISWAPRGSKLWRKGDKLNSILKIALYLAEEIQIKKVLRGTKLSAVCTDKYYGIFPVLLFITVSFLVMASIRFKLDAICSQ